MPSSRPDKIVIRKPKRVRKILSGAAADLRTAVLVYATAQVEAFLNDIISAVLRFDPRRLKTRVQGIETPKNVELAEIVDCKSKEDLLLSVIEKHLISLFLCEPVVTIRLFRSGNGGRGQNRHERFMD